MSKPVGRPVSSRTPSRTPSPGNKSGHSHKKPKSDRSKTPDNKPGFWYGVSTRFGHMSDKWKSTPTLGMFKTDHVIKLTNLKSKGCLQVSDRGEINCQGDKDAKGDERMHFVVTNHGSNIISLRSLTFPFANSDKFLRVKEDGKLYCNGQGKTDDCKFRLHQPNDGMVTLESYKYMYHHIAARSDGNMVSPKRAWEKNKGCQFTVRLIGKHTNTPAGWKVNPI